MPQSFRPKTEYPVALRELEVLRVTDVTPGMRRVTLTGAQLGAFTTPDGLRNVAFASTGFDDDIRLLFAYPGEREPVLPVIVDGRVTFAPGRRPLARAYTVRRYDRHAREIDVDFVLHGDGVATTWARIARPGDRIHVAGPSTSLNVPVGVDHLLVAGDETALPAIARLLEELPADTRAEVFIEIAEDAHRQPLHEPPTVSVTWLSRRGAAAGTTSLLSDALCSANWPDDSVFAWLAGEQATIRSLRRRLVHERGIPKTSIEFAGYWKHGEHVVPDAP